MNILQKRRFVSIIILVLGLGIATTLVLVALRQNIQFYYTPTQLINLKAKNDIHSEGARVRLGGMILKGSVKHEERLNAVQFTVTDFSHQVIVQYVGILPDLFKEGQGVVVTGRLVRTSHSPLDYFIADEVLAKHDENYMPPQLPSIQKNEPKL